MSVYEMDFEDDVEPMDFEYTYLEAGSRIRDTRTYIVSDEDGSFAVPTSVLVNPYSKLAVEANKVVEQFAGFSLSIDEPEQDMQATTPPPTTSTPTPDLCNSPASSNDDLLIEERNPVVHYKSNWAPADNLSEEGPSSAGQTDIPITSSSGYYSPAYHRHQHQHSQGDTHYHAYYAPPPQPDPMQTDYRIRFSVHTAAMIITFTFCAVYFYKDVQDKINTSQTTSFILQNECHRNYSISKCEINFYPALYTKCQEWERCIMSPIVPNRIKAIAETCAEFVEGLAILTPKAMAFVFLLTWIMGWIVMNLVAKIERRTVPQAALPAPPSPLQPQSYVPNENIPRLNLQPLPPQ